MADLFPWTFWIVCIGWGLTFLYMKGQVILLRSALKASFAMMEGYRLIIQTLMPGIERKDNVVPFRGN